jgi:hypothetical protein
MTAGQLWELVLDAKLLCRHMQMRAVCDMLQQAITPPPAVLQRRQQVRVSRLASCPCGGNASRRKT